MGSVGEKGRGVGDLESLLGWAMMNDPMFRRAVEFDELAVELMVGEPQTCRRDGRPLEDVRGVSIPAWHGHQDQMTCPLCSARYVQFVPDER